jgi:acetyltransferase-like isoleucine patch superfamily enzyme
MLMEVLPVFVRCIIFKLILGKCGANSYIDYKCHMRYPWRIEIGKNAAINRGCEFYPSLLTPDGLIYIDDNAVLGPNVVVFAAGHDYDFLGLPDTSAAVRIGKYTWIGGNSTILPGVTVGEGAIIGAGSVVTHDIPPYSVAVGVPAKVIKVRVLR